MASYLLSVLLARYLGIHQFGTYAYVVSVAGLAAGISQLGLLNLMVREISVFSGNSQNDKARGLYEGLCRLAGFAACVSILILLFLVWSGVFGDESVDKLALALTLPAIYLVTQSAMTQAACRGLGHLMHGMLAEPLIRPFVQVALIVIAFEILSIRQEALPALLAYVLATGVAYTYSRRILSIKASRVWREPSAGFDLSAWRSAILKSAGLGAVYVLSTTAFIVMAGFFGAKADVAELRIALQIAIVAQMGANLADTLTATHIARAARNQDTDEVQRLLSYSIRYSLAVCLPVVLILLVAGRDIIGGSFGPEFTDAYPLLCTLLIAYLAAALSGSIGVAAYSFGYEREVMLLHCLILVLALASSIYWYESIGVMSFALGQAFYMVIVKAYATIYVYRRTGIVAKPWKNFRFKSVK